MASSPPPSKRRRQNEEGGSKKHLYLALDDWNGGYSIHKLDAENMPHSLPVVPDAAALRVGAPGTGPMAFTALGSNIFIATNPRCTRERAPPTLVFDTATATLTIGPPLLAGHRPDMGASMAVGESLYAMASDFDEEVEPFCFLEVLSWAPSTTYERGAWDPEMEWSWSTAPPPPPFLGLGKVASYAVHPDGSTLFMSIGGGTFTFDTIRRVWSCVGDEWVLPFRGQAFFDEDLDAWVGLHLGEDGEDGYVCCCPVASRSADAATSRQPECKMLDEKLFRREGEDGFPAGRYMGTTLTYMGNSRFCLIENLLCRPSRLETQLRVTLFGLKYDHKGELRTKARRTTRSYEITKNTFSFSHAAFWM
ncbi:hypothetical protein ACP4OV_025476 [Aristida adscensionis]